MIRLSLIFFIFFNFGANASWFEDAKRKLGLGYQNYDECIIGEMKGVNPKNRDVKRAIKNKCNKDFPAPKPEYKTLFFDVTNFGERYVNKYLTQLSFEFYNNTKFKGNVKIYFAAGTYSKSTGYTHSFNYDLRIGNNFPLPLNFKTENRHPSSPIYYNKKIKVVIQTNKRN